jgi:FMN-dependent NADH-azoreductase
VPIDSPVDFCTPWFKQALNFLGITDINIIDASQLNKSDENLKKAQQEVNIL